MNFVGNINLGLENEVEEKRMVGGGYRRHLFGTLLAWTDHAFCSPQMFLKRH